MLTDDQKAAVLRVIDALWDVKGPRGRPIAEPFAELPDRTTWKNYYVVIPHPRCLNELRTNVENNVYLNPQTVYDDLGLVFANALHFNEDGSPIAKDARTLKEVFQTAWQSEPTLEPPAPPPVPARPMTPPMLPMDDLDASPVGAGGGSGGGDTNWESMKPRDKAGDEIVRKTELLLPRWKGPGQEGWMVMHDQDAKDPYVRYNEIIKRLKTHRDRGAETFAYEALNRIAETAVLPELSFTTPMSLGLIESRLGLRAYPSPKDFDMDLARLFEKGRRWFEEGSRDYGRVVVLQRLYQGLTSSIASSKALGKTIANNFSVVPAGPGFAKPLHSATSTSEDAVTTYRIQNKDRTFIDEIVFKGMSYKSGDYVHLMNPNDPAKPIIGQVFKLYTPDAPALAEQYVTVCWYFRPEQTYHTPQKFFWEHEVFKTGHFADHAIEDVIEKVGCQFMTRHIRGRPRPPMWYPNWPLYVCDSRYNDRDRAFVRIKNWNSCIPDELRKADFMPIQPYERTVMPRKVDSPFLHGIEGPGGLIEEEELRRKSKRAAAKAQAHNAPPPPPDATMADPIQAIPAPPPENKATQDRSLTVAAGGRAALGGDPTIETLPEDTIKHFDRDPRTGELLWFSGPPIQRVNPEVFRPKYSLEYLAFLAKKKAAAERERKLAEEEEEEMDVEGGEGADDDSESRRKRLRIDQEQEVRKHPAPPTLRDALLREIYPSTSP